MIRIPGEWAKITVLFFLNRCFIPSRGRLFLRDLLWERDRRQTPEGTGRYLRAVLEWACRAQDAADGGIAAWYCLRSGWGPGYPEVTGYWIPTLLRAARELDWPELRQRALRCADWELGLQTAAGGWPGSQVGQGAPPRVFNTAQVIDGLVSAYEETGAASYLEAARRGAEWILAIQEPDGSWRKFQYLDLVRVYDTRVAYPLLRLWVATGESRWKDAAVRQLDWALGHQRPNGWFDRADNGPDPSDRPLLHPVAYTVEGFLKSGLMLGEPKYVEAACRTAWRLLEKAEITKVPPRGRYDSDWKPAVSWLCLTGCAQMTEIWSLFYRQSGDVRWLNSALKVNDVLCGMLECDHPDPGVRGGVRGSFPIFGAYHRFQFVSWAAKYLADALMEEEAARRKAADILGR